VDPTFERPRILHPSTSASSAAARAAFVGACARGRAGRHGWWTGPTRGAGHESRRSRVTWRPSCILLRQSCAPGCGCRIG